MLREFDLKKELSNKKINPCNYIHSLRVPSGVKVYLSDEELVDKNYNELIPLLNNTKGWLKKNNQIISAEQMYIHTVGTSDNNLFMQTEAIDKNNVYIELEQNDQVMRLEDSINETLLNLNKIINPYKTPIKTLGKTNATSLTTLINKTLTCDKVKISLCVANATAPHGYTGNTGIICFIDNVIVSTAMRYSSTNTELNSEIEIENIKGSNLVIKGMATAGSSDYANYTLQEYELKV